MREVEVSERTRCRTRGSHSLTAGSGAGSSFDQRRPPSRNGCRPPAPSGVNLFRGVSSYMAGIRALYADFAGVRREVVLEGAMLSEKCP